MTLVFVTNIKWLTANLKESRQTMKKTIIKLSITFAIIIALSIGLYFIFQAMGLTDIDKLKVWVGSLGAWAWVICLLLQIVVSILLCFIPATNMTFIILEVALFGATWQTFLLAFAGVILSSVGMDLIGRFGGSKLVIKLVGQDDYEKATTLIKRKGQIYIPLFYLFPFFPDDAICCACGVSKINFWYNLVSIIVARGIGVATIVFGISLIPYETFTTPYEWIVCIASVGFIVLCAFYVANKIGRFIERRIEKKGGK